MFDPIADMLSRIKNSLNARQDRVDIPHSKIKAGLAQILVAEGYVEKSEILKRMSKQYIRLTLKYKKNKRGLIVDVKRVSRPGRRIYRDSGAIPRVQGGFGTAILSTSKGLMTDEQARGSKIGGEVLCYIW